MTAAEIAAGQSKAQVANALVILGRAAKDPLIVAAKLLSSVGANVADPKAAATDGKPTFYDVGKLVEEAKSYSANRSSEAITPVPPGFLSLRISLRQIELQLRLGLLTPCRE